MSFCAWFSERKLKFILRIVQIMDELLVKLDYGVGAPKVCVKTVIGNINGYCPRSSNFCLAGGRSWNYFQKHWAIPFFEFSGLRPSAPKSFDGKLERAFYKVQWLHS
jgi:hypothetical protein